ncbi:hypothetical protein FRACA_1460009 [Frankia canadensis]|uniref:ABM domain-containing protein n=1 Tax=Frankia canadensis TaxID=1836972 RepID=A0A2I2KLN3_9ACTN|nr:antibiotic biosynthesis monooxygenase [Frankia canadensis]SNQ46572.1 hypothetical protein FRACA_1460009 [Frankia canadensis]SOU53862.1 hypothetical protein FRACA_1460009 [Frankia canadensis]
MSEPSARSGPVAAVVVIVAKSGRADDLAALLTRMAEAATDEGTDAYAVHQDSRQPERFFLFEHYRDRTAFTLHRGNETLNSLGEQLGELAESTEIILGRPLPGSRPPGASPRG